MFRVSQSGQIKSFIGAKIRRVENYWRDSLLDFNVIRCVCEGEFLLFSVEFKMSRGSVNRINVPNELREILLDFTVNYLLEQPPEDVVTYACEFFNRLKESRNLADIRSPSVGEESVISEDG